MSAHKSMLFVVGAPRSGTTALVRLLNAHPNALIGMERFSGLLKKRRLTSELYEKDRFLTVLPEDVNPALRDQFDDRQAMSQKYDRAHVIGDKYPTTPKLHRKLLEEFPSAKFLFIVRNPLSVLESFQARLENPNDSWSRDVENGIRTWNSNLRSCLAALENGSSVVPVTYERLFGSIKAIDAVYEAIDLDASLVSDKVKQKFVNVFQSLTDKLTPRREALRLRVSLEAQFRPYRTIVQNHCILRDMDQMVTSSAGMPNKKAVGGIA